MRLINDLIEGVVFGVGLALGRILFLPFLLLLLAAAAWAGGWAVWHHAPMIAGARHVLFFSRIYVLDLARWSGWN